MIKLYLTEPQEQFVFSEATHPGMCAGYGAGKSQAGVIRILLKAIKYPGMSFAFVEPTFDLVRLIAWPRFQEILSDWGMGYTLNKSEAVLTMDNGSKIIFRSADNPARLVGFEVADVLIDEADVLRQKDAEEVWVKMIARARQKKPDGSKNTVGCVSTPEGWKWLYNAFEKNKRPGYELIRAPTSSNPYLPADYLDILRATYPPQLLEAYCEGKFCNLTSGSVYYGFSRELNHTDAHIEPGEALHCGADFNVLNSTVVIFVVRNGEPLALEELTKVRDTPAMARLLSERYKGHSVTVYPDASGQNTSSKNAGESDFTIMKQAGLRISVDSRNPAVRDRVNAVNAVLLNGEGVRRFKVNTDACQTLTECLEQQAYAPNGEPDKTSGHDHANDAAGYFIAQRYPIKPRYNLENVI